MKRGNVEKESEAISFTVGVAMYLKGITLDHIRGAFEKVGDYPKPVPKLGRPKKSDKEKLKTKYLNEESKGQKHVFTINQIID